MRGHLGRGSNTTRRSLRRSCAFLGAAAVWLSAAVANAQWQVDAYLGAPFFRGEDISISGDTPAAVDLLGSPSDGGDVAAGIRVGYWWALPVPLDFGLALDGSGVLGDLGKADFNFVPLTALLMARLRLLESEQFPSGRLQPYIAAGPSLVWSEIDIGLFSEDRWDLGGDGRAGLRVGLIGGLGVFGEYRYTYFTPTYSGPIFGLNSNARVSLDSSTHHANFGFSYEF